MPRKSPRMAVERTSTGSSLIEVLDRVLDKGIVVDAWLRLSLVGIDLVTVEARVVVASIETYRKYSDLVRHDAGVVVDRERGAQIVREVLDACNAHDADRYAAAIGDAGVVV